MVRLTNSRSLHRVRAISRGREKGCSSSHDAQRMTDIALISVHPPNRINQFPADIHFEHVAAGACTQHVCHHGGVVMGRKPDDLCLRKTLKKLSGRLYATEPRHAHVHANDVDRRDGQPRQHRLAVNSLRDHFDTGINFQRHAKRVAKHRMVIYQQHTNLDGALPVKYFADADSGANSA